MPSAQTNEQPDESTPATSPVAWAQKTDESTPAFAALVVYLTLDSARSLSKAAAKVGKSLKLMKTWSARWSWVERARAFDNHRHATMWAVRQKAISQAVFVQEHERLQKRPR